MSSKEYTGWIKYFKERPFGWREDHRAAILMQTTYQGKNKLEVSDFFPSLKEIKNSQANKKAKAKSFLDAIQGKSQGSDKLNLKD